MKKLLVKKIILKPIRAYELQLSVASSDSNIDIFKDLAFHDHLKIPFVKEQIQQEMFWKIGQLFKSFSSYL